MDEQQIPIQQNQTQPQEVEVQTVLQPKTISTFLGYSIIVLFATIAYAGVFWYANSYEEPKVVDWSGVVMQMQERRVFESAWVRIPKNSYEKWDENIFYQELYLLEENVYHRYDNAYPREFPLDYTYLYEWKNSSMAVVQLIDKTNQGYGREHSGWTTTSYYFISEDKDPILIKDENGNDFIFEVPDYSPRTKVFVFKGRFFLVVESRMYLLDEKGSMFELGEYDSFGLKDNLIYFKTVSSSCDSINVYKEEVNVHKNVTDFNDCKIVSTDSDYEVREDGVYYKSELIEGADPETFEYVGFEDVTGARFMYARDKSNVYYHKFLIEDADSDTFEVLGCWYAKDTRHIYFEDNIIEVADVNSFEVIENSYAYAKDDTSVYYGGNTIPDVDPENCTVDNLDGCKGTE